MSPEEIEKLTRMARCYARKKRLLKDVEDFVQEFLLEKLRGRDLRVDQAFADYMRAKFGRTGIWKSGDKKGQPISKTGTQNSKINRNINSLGLEKIIAPKTDRPACLEMADYLAGDNRVIMLLRYLWGLTEKEIGYLYGVSESRICQRLRMIISALKAAQ